MALPGFTAEASLYKTNKSYSDMVRVSNMMRNDNKITPVMRKEAIDLFQWCCGLSGDIFFCFEATAFICGV
jgi:hypothetical protein